MRITTILLFILLSCQAIMAQVVLQHFDSSNSPLPDTPIRCLAEDEEGALWVGTDFGLFRLFGEEWTVYTSENSGLADDFVKQLLWKNGLWIGGLIGGLQLLQGEQWTSYNTQNSDIPGNYITALAEDADEGIWVGTTSGVARLRASEWLVYDEIGEGWQLNTVSAIASETADRAWFGTINSGLVLWEEETFTMFQNTNSGLPDNSILSIAIDDAGVKWLATPSGGLVRFDEISFTRLREENAGITSISSADLGIHSDNRKIYATLDQGVFIYRGGESQRLNMDETGLPSDQVTSVLLQGETLWIGTVDQGLVQVSLPAANALSIVEERDDGLLIWPNPVSDLLRVEGLAGEGLQDIRVFDITGKELIHLQIARPDLPLDLSELSAGVYLLQVQGKSYQFLK